MTWGEKRLSLKQKKGKVEALTGRKVKGNANKKGKTVPTKCYSSFRICLAGFRVLTRRARPPLTLQKKKESGLQGQADGGSKPKSAIESDVIPVIHLTNSTVSTYLSEYLKITFN